MLCNLGAAAPRSSLVYAVRKHTLQGPMPPTETDLLKLALMAYEAAAEPALWPLFLKVCNDAISSDATLLQVHDLGRNQSNILLTFGLSSPLQQSYNEHYSKLNVWRQEGRGLYRPGAVNLDQELCSRPVFEHSEFYNDYLRRMDAAHSLGAVIARRQNQAPTLTALRGCRKGAYGDTERKVAQFLVPYLTRAWALYERLDLLAAGESVLDSMSLGIVFLGPGGVTVYSNRRAEEIFRADDGFSNRNRNLRAWDRRANARLLKSIEHALSPDRPPGPAAIGVPRTSSLRAYQVVIASLRARFRQFNGLPAPRAVVMITDPERPGPAKVDLLMQLYGLTRKEAELAVKLCAAKSVEQAAEEMRVTYETARTHLRHIFSKTETSRQTELLLLLSRLPGTEAG